MGDAHDDDRYDPDMFEPQDEERFREEQFPDRKTTWHGGNGPIAIKEMDTAHLVNTLKMIERRVWGKIGNFPPKQKRKMVIIACQADVSYLALEKEFMARIKKGYVTLGHFLSAIKTPYKKVKLR
jgi:hypothetical protein